MPFAFTKVSFVFCLCSLVAWFSVSCPAQPAASYHVQHFSDENGLPQNSVKAMMMGRYGFIWIATEGGIVRFDGHNLRTYTQENLGTLSDRISGFAEDTKTGSHYAFNEPREYVRINKGLAIHDSTYHPENVVYDPRPTFVQNKTLQGGSFVAAGRPGQYFLYSDQKIFFLQNGKTVGVTAFPGKTYFTSFPVESEYRQKVIAETRGMIAIDNFLGIGGALFYHLNSEGDQLQKITPSGINEVRLTGDIESDPGLSRTRHSIRLFQNRIQRQVFAYLNKNIYLVKFSEKDERLTTELLVAGFDVDEHLVSNMLYHDEARMLLLGSVANGLTIITRKPFQVYKENNAKQAVRVYYAHLPYGHSSVVTSDGAILGTEVSAPGVLRKMRSRVSAGSLAMLRDRRDNLWIIEANFVVQLSPSGKEVIRRVDIAQPISRIYQGQDEGVWVGCGSGDLLYIDPDGISARFVTKIPFLISFLYQVNPEEFWVGTSNGLFNYNLKSKKLLEIKALSKKYVRSVYSSRAGVTWVGTYGSGFFGVFNKKVVRMPVDAGKYLNHAHCIVEDQRGYFWITTNKGLFKASEKDLISYAQGKTPYVHYLYYDKTSGFLTNEFNGGCQPCAAKLDDGHFSFPSMNGLVWMSADSTPEPVLRYPFIIENLNADDRPIPLADTLRLTYNFKFLSFDLATALYANNSNLQFLYSVKKVGSRDPIKWLSADGSQRVNIYNLPAGEHLLVVRKITGLGGKYLEKRILLLVSTPWYLKVWFLLLVVLTGIAVFLLYTRWRLRRLRRQNILLSEKVEERTNHLSRTLEDLRISDETLQKQVQIQMRIISIINHDLHSPLRYLNTATPRFFQSIEQYLPDQETIRYASAITKSTEKVYRLTDELLTFIKSTQNAGNDLSIEAVDILDVLETKAAFFADIAAESLTFLEVVTMEHLTVQTNRLMLEIIVHNLIDNAIKHSYKNKITLGAVNGSDGLARIRIADTGGGMPPEILKWLNSPLQRQSGNDVQPAVPPNLGLGLIIVREIAGILKIRIEVRADVDGTVVDLLL